jgi:hypothetical protein
VWGRLPPPMIDRANVADLAPRDKGTGRVS